MCLGISYDYLYFFMPQPIPACGYDKCRSVQKDHTQLVGLHPENRHKGTDKPTAERVLKAFSNISLTLIQDTAGRELRRWLTPLSPVQQDILQRLGLDAALYRQLEIQNTGNGLGE